MRRPDGVIMDVPEEEIESFLSYGWSLVVKDDTDKLKKEFYYWYNVAREMGTIDDFKAFHSLHNWIIGRKLKPIPACYLDELEAAQYYRNNLDLISNQFKGKFKYFYDLFAP